MKTCKRCNVDKKLEDFHKSKSSKDGHSTWCKECQKSHKKEHYVNNKDKYITSGIKNRQWFYDLKNDLKCERCGFSHPAALDFHHIDPNEKEFNIGKQYFTSPKKKEKILNEIKKCIVLCSNCHRIEHAKNYNK